jgi:hypothetical protein
VKSYLLEEVLWYWRPWGYSLFIEQISTISISSNINVLYQEDPWWQPAQEYHPDLSHSENPTQFPNRKNQSVGNNTALQWLYKSKPIWNTYIEKTKCRNQPHRIIGVDVTGSKLFWMLFILLGFLSTVNIFQQESESVIPIVSCRKNLTSVKSVSWYNLFHMVMYNYLRNTSRLANLSVNFFTFALNSSFSVTDLFLDLESTFTAASAW